MSSVIVGGVSTCVSWLSSMLLIWFQEEKKCLCQTHSILSLRYQEILALVEIPCMILSENWFSNHPAVDSPHTRGLITSLLTFWSHHLAAVFLKQHSTFLAAIVFSPPPPHHHPVFPDWSASSIFQPQQSHQPQPVSGRDVEIYLPQGRRSLITKITP